MRTVHELRAVRARNEMIIRGTRPGCISDKQATERKNMSTLKYKAALWDMDGTLFNTKRGIVKAVDDASKEAGLPLVDREKIDLFIGPPIQYGFKNYYGLQMEDANRVAELFRKSYREKGYVLECDPYEGLVECLQTLKNAGVKLGVATLKKQDMAERIIKKYELDKVFDCVYGSDARDNLKKHDIIRLCCEDMGIDTSEAVMIGDTVFDAEGAEKAGSPFLAVTYGFGFHSAEDLDGHETIGTAATTAEIAGFFL